MSNQQPTQLQSTPGLPCPECRFQIQVTIQTLLSAQPIVCPICGLKLALDRQASKEGLNALRMLKKGLDQAEAKKTEALALGQR